MVGPSKILTVSYGTFSCTLEGFDEPFSTMRGIAEYFRDLAADDRYFGAEPPTPDAEMLHRIAEREIQHRVEARVDDGGITLRQLDDDQIEAPAEPEAVEETVEAAVAPVATAEVVEPVIEDAPAQQEDEFEEIEEPAPQEAESVAAKLARIRAAVSRPIYDNDHSYVEDQQTDEMFATAPISAAFDDVEEEGSDADDDLEDEQQAEPVAASDIEEPLTEPAESAAFEEEYEVEAEVEQDMQAEEDTDETPEVEVASVDAFEGEHEELTTSEYGAGFADVEEDEAELEAAPLDEHSPEMDEFEEELEAEEQPQEDALARVMDSLSGGDEVEETEYEPEAETEASFGEPAMAHMADMREDSLDLEDDTDDTGDQVVSSDDDSAEIEMVEDDQPEEILADADAGTDIDEGVEADEHVEVEASDADDPNMDVAAETEVEAVDESTAAGETSEGADADDVVEGGLSAEDEAELMATLRLVQQENDAESRADKEGRALLESQDIEQDGKSVSRILDVTNQELDESEGTRRRSAIAHLKAAVLATRADKILSKSREEGEDGSEMNQYRDDLARVVRPRRPENPSERRMAPLMLVSEQRVDIEEVEFDANAEAVRPRRVTSADAEDAPSNGTSVDRTPTDLDEDSILTDSNSFGEFADRMGATELPDLLEAAAAYASYVEGRPHFSRPQIMKAVQNFDEDQEFSREESLRSFGQLLRRGKIQKLKRGQFTISQNTRFNPEARAAGE